MKTRSRRRRFRPPSPTTIIALLALFVALGGSTYAAVIIPGSQIQNNSLGANKLKPKFRKKLQKAIASSQLPVPAGPQGPAGKEGPQGLPGSPGAEGKEGPEGKPITEVHALAPPLWEARNGTDGGPNGPAPAPSFTPKGLQFGPFQDGNQYAGVRYYGLQGVKLQEVAAVNYVASYEQEGVDNKGAAPYLRFFTEDGSGETHDIILSPNTQAHTGTNELFSGAVQAWEVRQGSIRYDDDPGEHPDQTWNQVLAAHGEDVIKFLSIQAGDGGGYTEKSTAWLKSLFIEAGDKPITWMEFRN